VLIPRDQLPDDAAEWSSVAVSLPLLSDDSPNHCPCATDDIFEYVQRESGDLDNAERQRLEFVRTAQVADAQYWLWTYTESDCEQAFVTCRLTANGDTYVGLASPNGLSPDQFILADYYEEVYWS
jgi:hypothetical protein